MDNVPLRLKKLVDSPYLPDEQVLEMLKERICDNKIINGRVYDPVHGIDGERKTIYIKDGSIVEGPFEGAEVIDAQGMVVMPGGVEVHSHIAGPNQRRAPDVS